MSERDVEQADHPRTVLDDWMLSGLLLHPEIREEDLARAARRRAHRLGLTVAAATSLTLVPAVSLAEDSASQPPIVTAACEISTVLVDGTPGGVLDDGSVCVQPVNVPAPAADEPPAPPPPPPPADAPVDPTSPATPPAPEPGSTPNASPQSEEDTASATSAGPSAAAAASAPARPAAATARRQTQAPAAGPGSTSRPAARRRSTGRPPQTTTAGTHRRVTPPKPDATFATAPANPAAGLPGAPVTPFYVTDEPVIPRFLVSLYKQAGRRYHVPWPILAAINEIETDFGRNVAVSSAGATGWMQFMPGTWRAYGVDADRNGVKDPDNPRDAIFSAARYLKASGAEHDMRRAIFAYNHAGWYVDSILLRAERIAAHQGERSRRLDRLLRAGQKRLERQVLADPRITLYECGREDVEAGRIDRRVLITLRFLAWSGLHPTVTSLECGHGVYTKSGTVSHHSSGNAVDIAAINGVPILGHQGSGSVTEAAIRELLTLRGAMAPAQIISLMTFAGADGAIAMGDHADHIHVGFRPLKPMAPLETTIRR